MSYYRIIDGIRLDRQLLETAERLTQGRGDGRISLKDAELILQAAGDGRGITKVEKATISYVLNHFSVTEKAKRWIQEQMDVGDDIFDYWGIYHQWLEEKVPLFASQLQKADVEKEMEALEKAVGVDLPSDFKHWYLEYPGEQWPPKIGGYLLGLLFLPIEKIISEREGLIQLTEENNFNEDWTGSVYPEEAVQPIYYDPTWIPLFTDDQGNYIGIDLAPGPKGTVGQIINFGTDEPDHFVMADSLTDFWKLMAEQVQRPEIEDAVMTNEEGQNVIFGLKKDSHLTDDLRELIIK